MLSSSLNISTILPELFLLSLSLVFLIYSTFIKEKSGTKIISICALTLGVALFLLILSPNEPSYALNKMYHSDPFIRILKILIIVGGLGSLYIAKGFYVNQQELFVREYPILILLSIAGMFFLVSSNSLFSFYIALELQSLPLYILASIHRDDSKSSESGLKYFILGAVSSGIILYGISLVYGFTGSTDFSQIYIFINSTGTASLGLIIGLVLLIVGICFKVSAVPFHMWTPDVYEGSPTPVTAFFATAPKVAAIGIFVKILYSPFVGLINDWRQVILFVAGASMLIGAIGAIKQKNFKRLIAYSSIGHIGFVLAALAVGNSEAIKAIILYLIVYVILSLTIFAIITVIQGKNNANDINAFSGISKTNPLFALSILIIMFSLAGIPPFAGFFSKFFVLSSVIDKGFYSLAIIGVLSSVISAFYYLRIVKTVYFDESNIRVLTFPFEIKLLVLIGAIFNSLFIFCFYPLLEYAEKALLWIQ